MFAVPGFRSLTFAPAHQPMRPAEGKQTGAPQQASPSDGDTAGAPQQNKHQQKKRKRDSLPEVTGQNLDALWKDVVEKRPKRAHEGDTNKAEVPPQQLQKTQGGQDIKGKKKGKKERTKKDRPSSHVDIANGSHGSEVKDGGSAIADGDASHKKEKPPHKKDKKKKVQGVEKPAPSPKQPHAPPQPTPALPVGLTPLQQKMRQKLSSARFRHLNQMLYTAPSAESLRLFGEQPEMFDEYHAGFRQQVEAWPENPVDVFIGRIKTRGRLRESGHRKDKESDVAPLPRGRDGHSSVVDLGCGDAAIARAVAGMKPRPKIKITSYDLHSPNGFVTVADIANLPLQGSSVDVAIFCLALMGTNWPAMVEEVARVVRFGGEVWIAEIKSRFARAKSELAAGNEGNDSKKGKKGKKNKPSVKDENGRPEDAFVEEQVDNDGRPSEGEEKFIRALARRGLKFKSRDGSNKMFVLMEFEKVGTKPTAQKPTQPNIHGRVSMKFVDDDDSKEDEAGILKPCVYKLR